MRYEYTITDHEGKEEVVKAMSWKKMFKSLLLKTPKFSGKIAYINKKKPLFWVSNYKKKKPRKRPGRHSKRPNKHSKRKPYRKQGRKKRVF